MNTNEHELKKKDVVVTGMGVVTAQGVGVEAAWEGIVNGRDVLRGWEGVPEGHPLRKMKAALCGEMARPDDLPMRLWGKLSRTQQLACVAMDEALASAGLPRRVGGGAGLFVGTTVCGMDVTERFYAAYRENRGAADAELLRRLQPYEVRALLARRHRLDGPGWVSLTTCVGSAVAIAAACDAIERAECELAVAGGSEAICRVVLSGFHSLKVMAAEGCRPFDKDRPGMTVGEGAGFVVLESRDSAERRGATILARIGGVGITCDAHHLTAPEPAGKQAVRAMREALRRAGIGAEEIGYVNAHGTGTRDNDAMEARAIEEVFGRNAVAVSSTKRGTGHTFGAAGVIEAVLCVKALETGILPVNAGSVKAEEGFGIRVMRRESLREKVRAVMSTNFAFGGNNTAIVLMRDEFHHGDRETRRTETKLGVLGVGIVTDGVREVLQVLPRVGTVDVLTEEKVAGMDVLAGLVIRAGHQAWRMAGMANGEDVGLIVVSGWGTMDATRDYLESMLEAEGKYASPRHFSRSVYSSAASLAAIHFGIHGPCLTLAFGGGEGDYVRGALEQAERMMAAGRCERVLVVWAEQYAAIAEELAKLAAEKLRLKKYRRYVERGLGYGAVAVMVSTSAGGMGMVNLEKTKGLEPEGGKPFASDAALGWIKKWFREELGVK